MLPEGHLIGWVHTDPKTGVVEKTGVQWARLLVSCEDTFKKETEQKKKVVYYFDCVAWNDSAKIIAEKVKAGEIIYLTYYMTNSRFKKQDGSGHQKAELTIRSFFLLGQRSFEELTNHSPEAYHLPQLKVKPEDKNYPANEEAYAVEKVDLVNPEVVDKEEKGCFDVYERYRDPIPDKLDKHEEKKVTPMVEDEPLTAQEEENLMKDIADLDTAKIKGEKQNLLE